MKIKTLAKFTIDLIKNPSSIFELKRWYFYYNKSEKQSPLDYSIPWMTFGAIDYLNLYLNKDMNLFEYGSGGSSLFFADKVKKIVSIEHDENWYNYEINKLKNLKNLELRFIVPQKHGNFKNKRDGYKGLSFDNYVNSIEEFKIKFDVIIIDGRQRNECFKKAISNLANHGIIVFDNFDREYYQKSLKYININDYEILNFKGFVPFGSMQSMTTIFRKNRC